MLHHIDRAPTNHKKPHKVSIKAIKIRNRKSPLPVDLWYYHKPSSLLCKEDLSKLCVLRKCKLSKSAFAQKKPPTKN